MSTSAISMSGLESRVFRSCPLLLLTATSPHWTLHRLTYTSRKRSIMPHTMGLLVRSVSTAYTNT